MRCVYVLASVCILSACACVGTGGGLNSISKTNPMLPGLRVTDVKALPGPPASPPFGGELGVWKYTLHGSATWSLV